MDSDFDPYYRRALELASQAQAAGEVPVGALLLEPAQVGDWALLAEASNAIVGARDPAGHAELRVIREACRLKGSERLPGSLLITTLEPCLMCSGAIVLARVARVHYFAPVQTGIGLEELLRWPATGKLNHHPVIFQVQSYAGQSAEALRLFFQQKRL